MGLVDAVALDIDAGASDSGAAGAMKGLPKATKLFDPEGVHEVELIVPEASWKAILVNAHDIKLERVYHKATVRIDGESYLNVGVRNFGDGSQQINPKKPNVRIKFNEFNDALHGPEATRNLRLKAAGSDAGFLKEPLFVTLLNSLGVAAPRFSFAHVKINGVFTGPTRCLSSRTSRWRSGSLARPPASATRRRAPAWASIARAATARRSANTW